jgi:hypothetical protein
MKTTLTSFIAAICLLFSFNASAQYDPCPAGCDADPVCALEDMCFRFEYFGATDQGNGVTTIKFKVINASRFSFRDVAFELPGSNMPAYSPTATYISKYKYNVTNTYQDSLIKFTGVNTLNYRYDQADVFRYNVSTAEFNNGLNTTIRVIATAGNLTGDVVFNLEECEDTPINPLPVALMSFNAAAASNGVALNWATATEENNAFFSVQHSKDGRNFESAGYVEGNGTSSVRHDYRFTHSQAASGRNYYRLKQVDHNGKYAYSKVVMVEVKATNEMKMTLYPNPVTDGKLNLKLSNPMNGGETAVVQVQDLSGRVVMSRELKGASEMSLDLKANNLKAGVYLVNLKAGAASTFQRVVVQ